MILIKWWSSREKDVFWFAIIPSVPTAFELSVDRNAVSTLIAVGFTPRLGLVICC